MRAWFPFLLLIVAILMVIVGSVAAFQPAVSHYVSAVASDTVRAFLYNGMAVVTFLPTVSLVVAILNHSTRYRIVTIWLSSLWLIYWLAVLVLYAVTKGSIR